MKLNSNQSEIRYLTIIPTTTIVPRLEYSSNLLNSIIENLQLELSKFQKLNRFLVNLDTNDQNYIKTINLERTISFSLGILYEIKNRLASVTDIKSIPNLSLAVPAIRTLNAHLHNSFPQFSQQLCELSVHLGSIIFDSSVLCNARLDFSRSNIESSIVFDEVKLITDSKISKQYPDFDFFKSCSA
jgi:hypothetical protein